MVTKPMTATYEPHGVAIQRHKEKKRLHCNRFFLGWVFGWVVEKTLLKPA